MNAAKEWPAEIIEAHQRRDLVIVVGAGVSMNSEKNGKHPPGWRSLIEQLAASVGMNCASSERVELEGLLNANRLLEAAEFIHAAAYSMGRGHSFNKELQKLTDGPVGQKFEPNPWHSAILELDPRVVITTNYDKLLERASENGYHVHSFKSKSLGEDVRNSMPVLVKLHGCIDSINDIVLTQSDYSRLHVDGHSVLQIVNSLLLTRVVLFLGYSLDDPDMRLMLMNMRRDGAENPSHFVLTEEMSEYRRRMLSAAFGVTPIEYQAGKHDLALQMLTRLSTYQPLLD